MEAYDAHVLDLRWSESIFWGTYSFRDASRARICQASALRDNDKCSSCVSIFRDQSDSMRTSTEKPQNILTRKSRSHFAKEMCWSGALQIRRKGLEGDAS